MVRNIDDLDLMNDPIQAIFVVAIIREQTCAFVYATCIYFKFARTIGQQPELSRNFSILELNIVLSSTGNTFEGMD